MTLQEMIQEVGHYVFLPSTPVLPFRTVRFICIDSQKDDFGPIETRIPEQESPHGDVVSASRAERFSKSGDWSSEGGFPR